jgi:hypothetical protein
MKDKIIPTGKVCGRNGCTEIGLNKIGRYSQYCPKHYRFCEMRHQAQRDGKVVPTWEECEKMLQPCLNEHGALGGCPSCGQQMQWKAGADKKIGPTISLQHNLDGTMCFICHSCNVGHSTSKLGDRFLEPTPVGFKRCADCDTVKPLDQFHKDRSKTLGTRSNCCECDNNRSRKYRAERDADPIKRAKYLAYMKEYNAAKKQEVAV